MTENAEQGAVTAREQLFQEVSPEEAEERIRAAIERAFRELKTGAKPDTLEGHRQREALFNALSEDPAATALLIGSYREGFRDRALQLAKSGKVTTADVGAPDPTWADMESRGALLARFREETLCGRCVHSQVCSVAKLSVVSEAFVAVSRCLQFIDLAASDDEE